MECFICGIKSEKTNLFSAIVREGVVPLCEECSVKESIPLIKRVGQIREAERNQTVYERLSIMAGLDPIGHKEKIKREEEQLGLKRNESRKPAEKKNQFSFPNLKQINPKFEEDLVRNYHWTIFNARRAMRLTQKQLADEIGEPEASVKLVERGILPDNYIPLIRKLQTSLGVKLLNNQLKKELNLVKETPKAEIEEKIPYWRKLGFLNRDMKKRENEELKQEEKKENKKEDFGGMRMLTQEEIDKITFSERGED